MSEIDCPEHYDRDWWAGLSAASRMVLRDVGYPPMVRVGGIYRYQGDSRLPAVEWRKLREDDLMSERKPILCLDFDGVIHSYTSGWQGADVIPDPPVPGAMAFMDHARQAFEIHVFSSRSGKEGGITAMRAWFRKHALEYTQSARACTDLCADIKWPTTKPPAMLTIDDRAITFTGQWPDMEDLLTFQPWNKRSDEP
jgi:hypothetical protein